jgi:hypothetical protein
LSDGSPLVCLLQNVKNAHDGNCYKYDLGQWNIVGTIPDLQIKKPGAVSRMLHFGQILLPDETGSHLVLELQIFFFSLFLPGLIIILLHLLIVVNLRQVSSSTSKCILKKLSGSPNYFLFL